MPKTTNQAILQQKKLAELRERKAMRDGLPFLLNKDGTACNAHKLYTWQMEFLQLRARLAFITAANQVGKSSALIIKNLYLGYVKELWEKFFQTTPKMFIYMYPDFTTATTEFEEKWVKTYLPRGKYEKHEKWGWKADYKKGEIRALKLASGVTIYFRVYQQQPRSLQASTVDMVTLDEETPEEHFDELMIRTSAVQGMVSMGFTATLGQEYLYRAMEMRGTPKENFPNAWKRQISLYDCLTYADGSPSKIWTKPKIENEIIPNLSSKKEIKKRVWGRFVKASGLVFGEFSLEKNTCEYHPIKNWLWYCGIDFGSGGPTGHKSAIVFVQVKPDWMEGRVVEVWSSHDRRVTQGDVVEQWKAMVKNKPDCLTYFDYAATDLGELANREGTPMIKAEKSHEIGVGKANMLFKNGQMKIMTGGNSGDTNELITELQLILEETPKNKRKDDHADAFRYAIASIPFRMTAMEEIEKKKKKEPKHPRMRFWEGLDIPQEDKELWLDETQNEIDEVIWLQEGGY